MTTTLTRRNFLGTSLALAGATRVANAASPRKSMMLGFSTYGMKTLATEQAIDVIADTDYDSIEITVWPGWDAAPGNMSAVRRKAVRSQLTSRKLTLTSLMEHVYPSADKAAHDKALERLRRVYQLANDLAPESASPPVVQTVLGGGQWEEKKTMFRDRVGEWAELGKSFGIVTCIKPHRGGGMSQPSEAVWLIEQLAKTKWVRMVYDYSHYAFRDIPLVDSIREALPYTAHVAVKDAVQENGRVRFALPGEAGTIDFPTLLNVFQKGGYAGDISCEVSGQVSGKPGYNPLKAVQTCYRNMSAAFEKAGIERV